ncbi:SCO family protein [Effusibacillus pohliae]|uniref:SCO family protein n=1 Tax=Effusibacillus pohliae TaxID=232270 RepID=UPI000371DE0B|nr:SCO family protein [Effusibacillus pohliae]
MHIWIQKNGLRVVIVFLALAVVLGIGYWFWWGATRLPVISRAPDFTLQNVDGQPVKFSDLGGKVRLVEFFYANCPDICPTTTANMVKIQDQLKQKNLFGKDVVFVSITFDPERDSPAVLKNYAKNLKIDPSGWKLLRGTEEATKKVANDFGVFVEKEPDGSVTHTTQFFLVDRNNNVRGKYQMGDQMPTNKVLDNILQLVRE